MKLRSALVLLVIALLVLPLAACGGDGGTTETTAGATATTAAGSVTTATGGPVGEQIDKIAAQALIDAIAAGAKADAVVRPLAGRVVSSATLADLYFVAMEFSGSTENFTGVWATDDPEGAGSFWAVDKVAQKNTTWPKGDEAEPKITMDDPAAQQALDKF